MEHIKNPGTGYTSDHDHSTDHDHGKEQGKKYHKGEEHDHGCHGSSAGKHKEQCHDTEDMQEKSPPEDLHRS